MRDALLKEMGQRMTLARKKAGYTQEKLADATGLSIKMISAAENGHKAMRPENIVKICNCLSVSTDYLLKGEDATLINLVGNERILILSTKQRVALQNIVDNFLSVFE